MGYVKVKVKVRNIHKPELEDFAELFADTGSIYTILRRERLEKLNVKPRGKRRFKTADGKIIEREVGAAEIEVNGQNTYSIVVFGENSDAEVLGVTTLEELGLQAVKIIAKQHGVLESAVRDKCTRNIKLTHKNS